MDEIHNLIPEEKLICIKDREYKIKKLSIKQVLLLTKFIFNNIYQNKEKFAVFSTRISEQNNQNNLQDVLVLLDLLEEQQIYMLLGILLNEVDLKFIEQNIDFDLGVDIVKNLVELNNKNNIKKNIQRIMELLSEKKQEQIVN